MPYFAMRFTEFIPQEIVIKILQCCDFVEVLRFSQTCKAYYELVASSSLLQLHIELQASGYQLSDEGYRRSKRGAAAGLLDEFRRFRDGWLYMKIGKPLRLEPVDADMRLYELRQGYYAAALSSSYALPEIVKLTGLHDSSSRILTLGIQFSEFQIDPSQGLMVLVAVEAPISMVSSIHLRSVHTGSPHTSALHPDWAIQLPFHMERRSSGIFVEVMDELLAIKYVSYEKDVSNILIWNWKRGILLNRIECRVVSCTFGFLTPNSLLLFQSTETPAVNLLIYENIRTPCYLAQEHQAHCNVADYTPMFPSFEFGFPEFHPNAIAYLLMRAEPAPTLYSAGPAMFLPRPISRVIQLSMTIIRNIGHDRGLNQYQIFLSKERLLKFIASQGTPSKSPATVHIPWEVWGEHSTRWFGTMSAISPWICRAHGTRFIQTHPFGDDHDQPLECLSILEFHQPTVRRFSSLGCDERLSMWSSKEARRHVDLNSTDEDMEYVTNALLNKYYAGADDNPVFVDTIDEDVPSYTPFNGKTLVTRLPYRIVTRRRPVPKHSGWMMDNDLIIGMPGDDLENIQNEHMNIFTPMA